MRNLWFVVAWVLVLGLLVLVTTRMGPPSITAVSPFGKQGGSLHGYCWGSRGFDPNCGSPGYEPPEKALVMSAPWKFRVGYGDVAKAGVRVYSGDALRLELEATVQGREIVVDPRLPPGIYLVRVSIAGPKGDVSRSFRLQLPES